MLSEKAVLAIVNKSSRSTPDDAESILKSHCDMDLKCIAFDPETMGDEIEAHLAESDAPIIVWGGDGTICLALELIDNAVPLVALPGGTMNLVHKEIHGDILDVTEILSAANNNALKERTINRAKANDVAFYVAAMVGNLTKLTDVREAVREGRPLHAAMCLFSEDTFDLDRVFTVIGDTENNEATALAAFINNEHSTLDISAINPEDLADLLAVSLEAGVKDWRDADRIHTERQKHFCIEGQYNEIHVTLDGEPKMMSLPLTIRLEEDGARVLALTS